MMFETNIQNNSARISLARASQLTGYHQDYLGQLCRLGKLEAVKIGRNWFTSPEALNSLSAPVVDANTSVEDLVEEVTADQEAAEITVSQPVITENVTIGEVDGMPIAIRTLPTPTRNTNSVQGILTNLRIESLQQEVMELRKLLFRLMDEVKSHTNILQTRETVSRVQDSLKHSYVSNFDFNAPEQRALRSQRAQVMEVQEQQETPPLIWQKPKRSNYVLVNWVASTAAIVAISFMTIGLATGSFFGQEAPTTTTYYRSAPQQINQPEVAGAASIEDETLPTDSAGELVPIMIR